MKAILIFCIVTFIVSCGNPQGDWVGTWSGSHADYYVRFDKDGTVYNKFYGEWVREGTYEVHRNKFVINTVGATKSGTWKIKGSTLTLYQNSEVISILERIN